MDPMKKHPTASTAAKMLRISREQVFKLIRQGKLRRGPVAKINHRWHTTVMIDAQFNTQREARGLKPIFPESKQPPRLVLFEREKKPFAPSPIQTVTPPAESQPAFLVSARGYLATWHLQQPTLYIHHNTATFDFDGEAERLDRLVARAEASADYVMTSAVEEKCRNAMNICLEAQKACDKDMQECRSRAAECKGESAHVDEVADACRLHKDSALKCAAHVDEMDNAIRNWRDREASHHQKCENSAMKCQDIKDSITRYQHEVDSWAMEKMRTIKASELTCTRCTAILAAAGVLQLMLAAYYTLCHFNII